MKSKKTFIVVIVVVVSLIIALFCTVIYVSDGMSDNHTYYSNNIIESKNNNLFLGYYRPLKDSVILATPNHRIPALCTPSSKDSSMALKDTVVLQSIRIKAEKIWCEKNWRTEHNLHFWKGRKNYPGIHIVVPYFSLLPSELKVEAFIRQDFSGCRNCGGCLENYPGLGFAYTMDNRPDTITLFFRTNYTGAGYEDTIKYIRE